MNYADDVRETARVIYASRRSQNQLLQDAPAAFKELGRQQVVPENSHAGTQARTHAPRRTHAPSQATCSLSILYTDPQLR